MSPMHSSLARITVGRDDAPTLVLLHGITSSAISQADAINHWARRGYRVIAVDARGHGLSPRWEGAKLERAGEQLVDDALDLAREADAHRAGVNTVRPHQAPARNRPRTPTAARPTRPSPTLPTPKPCQPWLSWNRIVSGFAGWEVFGVVVDGAAGDV